MHQELVSIIVPIYNVSPFLGRCINSLLSQTYSNFELLLIDDGSEDESGQICDAYAKTDSRIRVFHNKNMGLSSSRNYGLAHSKGTWISFIDGDDWVSDDFIEKLYNLATRDKADIVYCDWFFAYKNDNFERCFCFSPGRHKTETLYGLILDSYHVVWNKIYRKDFLEKYNLLFPKHIQKFNEDTWFSLRAFFFTEAVAKVNAPLYYYNRENEGAITRAYQSEQARMVRSFVYQDALNFFSDQGVLDDYRKPILWRVLQEKTWMVFYPEMYAHFNDSFPEAKKYILNNPLLGWKMKIIVWIISHGKGGIVKRFITLNKK